MEVSAITYPAAVHRHARSPLLRLQTDETLIKLTRSGNEGAFEALVSRYESRLLSFCRHLLRSHEDAEDILQEVFSSAFAAIHADNRPINARPWLYRIARNRCLNHLRRIPAIGLDSMDVMFAEHGVSVAEKVEERETFRLLVKDIHQLPETQRSALILRELEALSYEQIAEAMETTVPSVKSLLVRARVSLAEASKARLLSCAEVRLQLGEVAEGLLVRASSPVRRHLRACEHCDAFSRELRRTHRALAALAPAGPLAPLAFWRLVGPGRAARTGAAHAGAHTGSIAGSTVTASGSGVTAVAAGAGGVGTGGGLASAAVGVLATKTVAGIAAAVLVTAGAVSVGSPSSHLRPMPARSAAPPAPIAVSRTPVTVPGSAVGAPARPVGPAVPTAATTSLHPASVTVPASGSARLPAAAGVTAAGPSVRPAAPHPGPGRPGSGRHGTADPASPAGGILGAVAASGSAHPASGSSGSLPAVPAASTSVPTGPAPAAMTGAAASAANAVTTALGAPAGH